MFNEKLKELVRNSDETKEQIAKELEISTKQLKRYTDGEQEPSISKLKKICQYFKVSADWLLETEEKGGEEDGK